MRPVTTTSLFTILGLPGKVIQPTSPIGHTSRAHAPLRCPYLLSPVPHWSRAGEKFLVEQIRALKEVNTVDVPLSLLHRTLTCVLSAQSGERLRCEAPGLQRKVLADLEAGNRQPPVTLIPLLDNFSISDPGVLRCAMTLLSHETSVPNAFQMVG